jgi:hypothetical protein
LAIFSWTTVSNKINKNEDCAFGQTGETSGDVQNKWESVWQRVAHFIRPHQNAPFALE